jgi:hypothetical protein
MELVCEVWRCLGVAAPRRCLAGVWRLGRYRDGGPSNTDITIDIDGTSKICTTRDLAGNRARSQSRQCPVHIQW